MKTIMGDNGLLSFNRDDYYIIKKGIDMALKYSDTHSIDVNKSTLTFEILTDTSYS